jgi:PAS domain S-box-containing protein
VRAAKHKLFAGLADVCGMSELLRILPISAPRRRSDRVSIGFPVEVAGVGAEGETFNENTTTMAVSRYGCCVGLWHRVNPGNNLTLKRLDTNQDVEARVVSASPTTVGGRSAYGLEATEACDGLWGIRFSSSEERRLDALQDGMYFVDRDRKITFWSEGAEKASGYTAGEAVGKHCYNNLLKHVDEHGRSLCTEGCPLSRVMLDGEPRELTMSFQDKDGHRVPVQVRAQPIRNSMGRVIGAVEVFSHVNIDAETPANAEPRGGDGARLRPPI